MSAFLRYIKSFSDYLLKERNYSVHTHESYVRDVTQYIAFSAAQEENPEAVSYTHLTLPTIYSV